MLFFQTKDVFQAIKKKYLALIRRRPNLRHSTLKMQQKTMPIVGIALASLISVIYVAASTILLKGYEEIEQRQIQEDIDRILQNYTQRLNDLILNNKSWSEWDETYKFVQQPTKESLETNYRNDTSLESHFSFIVFVNASGKIVYGEKLNLRRREPFPLPDSVERYIQANSSLWQHASLASNYAGIILLPEGPAILTAHPILTSKHQGPIRGTLILGRYLDAKTINSWSEAKDLNCSLHRLDIPKAKLDRNLQSILDRFSKQTPIVFQKQNDRLISGYILLNEIFGKPAVLLQVDMPRELYQQGQKSLHYLIASLSIVGLLFGVTIQLLVEKLNQFWHYSNLVTQASEGICLIHAETKHFLEINKAFERLLGYSDREIINLTLYDLVLANRDIIDAQLQRISLEAEDLTCEQQYRCKQGTILDVEVSIKAIDYIGKKIFCIVVRDITERKRAEVALRESERRLAWQATHDALTGLVNRQEFDRLVHKALEDSRDEDRHHVLCYMDLDQFKLVNDTCGHKAGDELLIQVTALLQAPIRSTDVLARLGGDEFGLLLLNCPLNNAVVLANKLRQNIQEFRFIRENKIFSIGVSIGLVSLDAESKNLGSILSAADAACYAAKNKGRNRVQVYLENDSSLTQQHGEMQWASKITQALDEKRFCLYHQKIVPVNDSLSKGEHYEILVRMLDETGKIIPPMAFIPAAERYNLMQRIDRFIVSTLFATQKRHYQEAWQRCQKENYSCLYSVNLSGASINDDQFSDFLYEQFTLHDIPPQLICFEITETVAITNLSKALKFIQKFRQLGCNFALDDFGSGMSSFTYLKSLPVDYLKIDGYFVKDILDDPIDLATIGAINQIGHLMGLKTIAEFVENEAILVKLREIGVDYAQGYGIGKPIPLQ